MILGIGNSTEEIKRVLKEGNAKRYLSDLVLNVRGGSKRYKEKIITGIEAHPELHEAIQASHEKLEELKDMATSDALYEAHEAAKKLGIPRLSVEGYKELLTSMTNLKAELYE